MYYKLDSTQASLREYWWGTPNPLIVVALLTKLLRIRLPGSVDDPNVDSLEPFRIAPAELPEEVRRKFHANHEELQNLGFHSPVCYWIHDVKHKTDIYQAVYQHNSGQAVARVHYRVWHFTKPAKEYFFPVFLSAFTDGTYLISTAGKPDILAPPACRENRKVAVTATDLWSSHQKELQEQLLFKTVRPVRDERELLEAVEAHHATVRDFHVERGVFVPMSEEEEQSVIEAAQAATEAVSEGGEVPPDTSDILDEIEKLQNKRTGWGTGLILLVVSVGLFLALGAARWSWEFVALLLPILFFHEMGHYATMRLFRYSNVKMFFIPLLGAAVSGRHYNVPGWKKVMVSLAGPLPGIFLGTGLGAAAVYFRIDWLQQAAMLAIFLNAFNLLPILPLDGGWVMHSLLFSRHYVLDAGFRILAVATLLGSSYLFHDNFLFFFGLLMAGGLPISFRMAGVISSIRAQGISTASPDDQSIAPETAEAIAGEVRKRFSKGLTNKNLAQFTLQAFEALNARPPGIVATILLGGVYVGSFLFALVAATVFTIGLPILMPPEYSPTHPIEVHQIETAGADGEGQAPEDEVTIVATYKDTDRAAARFAALRQELPADATLVHFGPSVLLSVRPGGQITPEEWEARLVLGASNIVNSARSYATGFGVAATAPSKEVADRIVEAMEHYCFTGLGPHIAPPWHPDSPPTPAQQTARKFYSQLLETERVYDDPQYTEVSEQLTEAFTEKDIERSRQLQKQLQQLRTDLAREKLQQLSDESDDPMERELIELYRRKPVFEFVPKESVDSDEPSHDESDESSQDESDEPSFDEPGKPLSEEDRRAHDRASHEYQKAMDAWLVQLSERLGPLPRRDGDLLPGANRFSLSDGMVDRTGMNLELTFYEVTRPVDGAPAIIRWLADQGCTDMKYTFFGDL